MQALVVGDGGTSFGVSVEVGTNISISSGSRVVVDFVSVLFGDLGGGVISSGLAVDVAVVAVVVEVVLAVVIFRGGLVEVRTMSTSGIRVVVAFVDIFLGDLVYGVMSSPLSCRLVVNAVEGLNVVTVVDFSDVVSDIANGVEFMDVVVVAIVTIVPLGGLVGGCSKSITSTSGSRVVDVVVVLLDGLGDGSI